MPRQCVMDISKYQKLSIKEAVMELKGLRIKDMQSGLTEGRFTSVELLEAVYKRIEDVDEA